MKRLSHTFSRRCGAIAGTMGLSMPQTQTRSYYWWYAEDFVPEGETTSRFQSSDTPSIRKRIIKEYALSPSYGSRNICVVIGSTLKDKREFVTRKPAIRAAIEDLLGLVDGTVELGIVEADRTTFARRIGKGASLLDKNGARTSLQVEVTLPEDMDPEEVGKAAFFLAHVINANPTTKSNGVLLSAASQYFASQPKLSVDAAEAVGEQPILGASSSTVDGQKTTDRENDFAGEVDAVFSDVDVKAATEVFEELGVTAALLPARLRRGATGYGDTDSTFDMFCGEDITMDDGLAAADRWVGRDMANEEYLEEQQSKF